MAKSKPRDLKLMFWNYAGDSGITPELSKSQLFTESAGDALLGIYTHICAVVL